jgi:hypothetical protein
MAATSRHTFSLTQCAAKQALSASKGEAVVAAAALALTCALRTGAYYLYAITSTILHHNYQELSAERQL